MNRLLLLISLVMWMSVSSSGMAQGYRLQEEFNVVRIAIGGFKIPDEPNLDERVYFFEIELHLKKDLIRYRKNASKSFKISTDTIDYSYFNQEGFYKRLDDIIVLRHLDTKKTELCDFWEGRFFRVELRGGQEGNDFAMKTYEFGHPKSCTFPSDKQKIDTFIHEYIRVADLVFPSFSNYLKRN